MKEKKYLTTEEDWYFLKVGEIATLAEDDSGETLVRRVPGGWLVAEVYFGNDYPIHNTYVPLPHYTGDWYKK